MEYLELKIIFIALLFNAILQSIVYLSKKIKINNSMLKNIIRSINLISVSSILLLFVSIASYLIVMFMFCVFKHKIVSISDILNNCNKYKTYTIEITYCDNREPKIIEVDYSYYSEEPNNHSIITTIFDRMPQYENEYNVCNIEVISTKINN